MSLLPQQKKSTDEIAKLRESLGIVAPPPEGEEIAAEIPPVAPAVLEIPAFVKVTEISPVAEAYQLKEVPAFARAERIPVLTVEENGPPPHGEHLPEATPLPVASPIPAPHAPKVVRSLRKSEQVPLAPLPLPAPESKLPIHRHSGKELHEIRRHEALAALNTWTHPQTLTAHLALVIPGYLFAIGGAVCFYFYDLEKRELRITAACAAIALLIAAFIFIKKPLSRHHAAFIGVMALFVIVFGALYYFPQLRHGT